MADVAVSRKMFKFVCGMLLFFLFFISIVDAEKKPCVDRDHRCLMWKRDGKCLNPDVQKSCSKSCKLCKELDEAVLRASVLRGSETSVVIFMVFAGFAVIALFVVIVKCFTCGEVCKSKGTLKKKTVVITGGTDGIGLETVFHLAARKARVIIGCRNLKKGFKLAKKLREQTGQDFIEIKKLDLSSLDSVREFAEECNERKHIDILINNAAVITSKKREVTTDGFEKTFQVNYLSHYLLTKLLFGKLKESSPSRVINIVDDCHKNAQLDFSNLQGQKKFNNFEAYRNSKLALLLFTQEASRVLKGLNVTVNAVHPGRSVTNLWRNCFPYSYELTWYLMKPFTYLFWKSADMGAETTYYCSLDSTLESTSGKLFSECKEDIIVGTNDEVARKLWETSERLIRPKRLTTITGGEVKNVTFQKQAEENSDHDTLHVLNEKDTKLNGNSSIIHEEDKSVVESEVDEKKDDVTNDDVIPKQPGNENSDTNNDGDDEGSSNNESDGINDEQHYNEENNNNIQHEHVD